MMGKVIVVDFIKCLLCFFRDDDIINCDNDEANVEKGRPGIYDAWDKDLSWVINIRFNEEKKKNFSSKL